MLFHLNSIQEANLTHSFLKTQRTEQISKWYPSNLSKKSHTFSKEKKILDE